MKFPDLLATKNGRLVAFFFLYLTEGIPLGFTATAIATQMRRQGMGPEAIGLFVGSLYLPWSYKFLMGPFVDVFSSDRFGRRRTWIIAMQVMLVLSLLAAMPVNFTTELKFFTAIIFLHNCFGATQDVAIDALACNVLQEHERGVANGVMFGGAYLGMGLGGAGVLYLLPYTGLPATFVAVALVIAAVTLFVALPLREPAGPSRPASGGGGLDAVGREIWSFLRETWKAFTGSRAAWLGLIFAILPIGAYALNLALQNVIAVELGFSDTTVGHLSLSTSILTALSCVAGGWLSDRFGRRRMLALFIVGTTIPGLVLAFIMQQHGWILPVDPQAVAKPVAPDALILAFWGACLVFAVFHGLMYGTRTALMMDITTPAVAATQFTAYMAVFNFVIAYTASWQGFASKQWGYPTTLTIDSLAGLLCLALLPFLHKRKSDANSPAPAEAT